MSSKDKAAADFDDTVSTQLSTKSGSIVDNESDSNKGKNDSAAKVAKTWSEMFRIWPYQSFLIVIMEFSIMLTALNNVFNLYYINVLGFDPDTTVVILSISGIVGGIVRLIGSSISDGYLGKFRAIFYGSCFYILGKIVMTFSTFLPVGFPHPWLDFTAQLIIMFGTSAMGPSISPFGGDQFEPHQEKMISVYYSMFYASINIGAVISNMVMPILRSRPCFGKDSCYPLSFSVSTIGVICSFLIFIVGSKRYVKLPPKGNVFTTLYRVVKTSMANKNRSKKGKYDKFLDYYFDTHNCEEDQKCLELRKKEGNANLCQKEQIIDDFRALKRLLIIFIPMPMFWALYDQQYTVWMNQALLLDGRVWGDFRLLPDQMQVVNPVLIIVLIFLFQSGIYPFFERFVRLTPLRKMVAGGFIAAFAFVVSGIVQLKINPTLPDLPQDGHAFVSFVNTFQDEKCTLNITHLETGQFRFLKANSSLIADKLANRDELFDIALGQNEWKIEWANNENASKCSTKFPTKISENIQNETSIILIGQNGHSLTWADTKKPTGGTGQFKIGVVLSLDGTEEYSGNLAMCRVGHTCDQHSGKDFYAFVNKSGHHTQELIKYGKAKATQYPYIEVRPGSWNFYKLHNDPMKMREEELNITKIDGIQFDMEDQGGIYTIFINGNGNGKKYAKTVHQVGPPNSISILWQLPQILVISIAEILVSITGLEFAYSQSGLSMKAIAHACWGITSSLGSIIIIIITKLPIENLATKAFVCAGAMVLDVLLLAYLATFKYKYRKGTIQQDGNEEEDTGTITSSNESMGKGEKSVRFTKLRRKNSSSSTKLSQIKPKIVNENGKDVGNI